MLASYTGLYPLMVSDIPGCPTPLLLQHLQQAGRAFARETESWIERLTKYIVDADAAYDTAYDAAITAGKSVSAAELLGDVAYDAALAYTLSSAYDAEMLRPFDVWDTGDDDDTPVDASKYDFDPSTKVLTLKYAPTALTASAWATLTVYAVGTNVIQNSAIYECGIAHTAGTFAVDLAAGRWTLVPNGLIVKVVLLPSVNATDLATWYMERWAEAIMAKAKATLCVMPDKPWTSPDRLPVYQQQYDSYKNMAIRDRMVENKSQGLGISTPSWIP